MAMNKDEKRNIMVGVAVGVLGLIIIWYFSSSNALAYKANPNAAPSPDGAGVVGVDSGMPGYYTDYNIPGYNPGNMPNITSYVGGSPVSTGGGCCDKCAGDEPGLINTQNIGMYYGVLGMGAISGGA